MAPLYNLGSFFVLLAAFCLQNAGFLMVNQNNWSKKPMIYNIRGKRGQEGIKALFIAKDAFPWLRALAKLGLVVCSSTTLSFLVVENPELVILLQDNTAKQKGISWEYIIMESGFLLFSPNSLQPTLCSAITCQLQPVNFVGKTDLKNGSIYSKLGQLERLHSENTHHCPSSLLGLISKET